MKSSYNDGSVTCEVADGIAHIGLNAPATLNAMTPTMVDGMTEAVADVSREGIKQIVLFGHGNAFSGGASLDGYQTLVESVTTDSRSGLAELMASERRLTEMARTLSSADVTSVAAVKGWVIGQGLEVALACDFIVAEPDAVFWLPETQQGWNVGMGATHILTQAVGRGWARRMLLLGDKLPAVQAEALGLVSRIASPGAAIEEALRLLAITNAASPLALQFQKKLLDLLPTMSIDDSREFEIMAAFLLASTDDPREAMRAFEEGRQPNFSRP